MIDRCDIANQAYELRKIKKYKEVLLMYIFDKSCKPNFHKQLCGFLFIIKPHKSSYLVSNYTSVSQSF